MLYLAIMPKSEKRKPPINFKSIFSVVLAFVIPMVIVFTIQQFWISNFYVPSASMETTLSTNDRVFAFNTENKYDTPERGDIVVFEDTKGWLREYNALNSSEEEYLVKRVIGLPGDVISCCDDGNLVINGEPYPESYIVPGSNSSFEEQTVPEGYIFVLGDNREFSADSRYHIEEGTQFINLEDVDAKVFFVYWPLEHLGTVE